METKNIVIAMMCASIVILSVATPISAVELKDSGMSGEIDGTGAVTGSVSLDAIKSEDGTANIEASIEASVRLDGPGSAECSQEGPVTHTLDTPLGTIVADVSEDSNVNAAVAVVGDGSASADAYVGTRVELGESEVVIESEISSRAHVETNGGSASATASATGTTTGDGISYATGCPPAENDATSRAVVSGNTEANAVVSGTAEADSYAVVGSTDYAGHYAVDEDSYIEAGSYAWSDDDDSKASADSSANGEAYQYGQAENCASSETYAEGELSTAVATQGDAYAESGVYIWSSNYAYKDTDYAYVYEDSDIDAWSYAASGTDGKASAESYADGDTGAAGSACDCVYLDTSAKGIVSTAVQTQGDADAWSDAWIWSYGDADKDTDGAYVDEYSEIWTSSVADSDTDGIASAMSYADGDTGATGSACDCVFLDTSAIGIGYTAVQTEGPAYAESYSDILSYGDADKDTDGAYPYVYVDSEIDTWSHANSGTEGIASAMSYSKGYTGAAGSACDCVYSDTSAIGIGYTVVQTEGPASASSYNDIWSYGWADKDTDGAYVEEYSEIDTWAYADSGTGGIASAGSASIGYTGAAGSACGCVYSDTSAIGIGYTVVQTEGPASADSYTAIWSYDEAYKGTDDAYVYEYSEIAAWSYAESDTDGKASAGSASKGYTGAAGSACDCLDSWTNAKGAVQVKTETDGDAWISTNARLTSQGWINIGRPMGANSVIHTGATAMYDSNSAGTATADGSTEAGASDSCTGECVGTGILDGEGETIVNPFNWMDTSTYAGFAYANAIPDGFEAIDFEVYIDTTGPNEAYSYTEAIATIP